MIPIPNPLRIACTECHRDACVEFQNLEKYSDTLVIAAECGCGRVVAMVDGLLIRRGYGTQQQPLIMNTLRHDSEIGTCAKAMIAEARLRIAHYERVIAAATWARDKPRPA